MKSIPFLSIFTRTTILVVLLNFFAVQAAAQSYLPTWESLDQRPLPVWYSNAKFGIFIHWGVYSVPAYRPIGKERYASYAEWYEAEVMDKPGEGKSFHDRNFGSDFEYRAFAPLFKAELFNPLAWAGLIQQSGAKYVVLTAKHHDGFCLWPTKDRFSKGWNSGEVGPKRDVVGELTRAVRAKGLKMGLYYSLLEWETNPKKGIAGDYYIKKEFVDRYKIPEQDYIDHHILPQLKELVAQYQPAVIFADGAWDYSSEYWKSKEFLSWLYNNAPNKHEVVVNDRWGTDTHERHGDYFTSEYASNDSTMNANHPWEENQGIGGSYGYNRAETIEDYKTSKQLIDLLVDRVSRGGNLLLNISPLSDGRIPELMQERLLDIGSWLRINGEAIFETKAWTRAGTNTNEHRRYTSKTATTYAICLKWPEQPFSLLGTKVGILPRVWLLGSPLPVRSFYQNGKLTVYPPPFSPNNLDLKHAFVFKIENFK